MVLTAPGCHTLTAVDEVPARITEPTDASRAALQAALNEALGTSVTLAEDALTTSSLLTLEHNPPGRIEGVPVQGRKLAAPVQFRLLLHGSECVLLDPRNGDRQILSATTCVAE